MGCLCPTLPSSKEDTSSKQTAKTEAPAAPASDMPKETERKLVGAEEPVLTDSKVERSRSRKMSRRGSCVSKTLENSNVFQQKQSGLSDMNTQYSKTLSRFSTIVRGSSSFERTYSYVQDQDCLPQVLTESEINGQEVLVLGEKIFCMENLSKLNNACYSLISQKMYVRKAVKNQVHVKSPTGERRLYCHPSLVKETLYLAEGVPMENVRLIDNKYYVLQQNLDLELKLVLKCKNCKKIRKHEYSVAMVELNMVCECEGEDFQIQSLACSSSSIDGIEIPLWLDGVKVSAGQMPEYLKGGVIRAIGCNNCWKFSNECAVMECGCLRCKDCRSTESKCVLCTQ